MTTAEHSSLSHAKMIAEKRRVAITSVVAAVFLTSMKLGIGLWTGSLGILSEAAHSGLDLLAAAITLLAVRLADRPPDKDHHFGHGKFENMSALVETLLLLITCAWILYEAFNRLATGQHHIDVNVWSFVVIIVSILIDFGRSRALSRVARKYHSQALEADALHFQTDIYSSAVVLLGLATVTLGFPEADAIAASMVAMIVIWISWQLGRRTIDVLLDRVPAGMDEAIVSAVSAVPGVEKIISSRIRQSGATLFADLVVGIARTNTFDQAHRIMDAVEQSVAAALPRTDVTVHAEPVIGRNEDVASSVSWLVQHSGHIAHNITVLEHDDRRRVELDIEYPTGTSFVDAHEASARIEAHLLESLPGVTDVNVHLEERNATAIQAEDVTGTETGLVERVSAIVRAHTDVTGCSSLHCFQTARGLRLSLTCSLRPGLSLKDAHIVVNTIETEISALDPRILKIYIHAEPEGGPVS